MRADISHAFSSWSISSYLTLLYIKLPWRHFVRSIEKLHGHGQGELALVTQSILIVKQNAAMLSKIKLQYIFCWHKFTSIASFNILFLAWSLPPPFICRMYNRMTHMYESGGGYVCSNWVGLTFRTQLTRPRIMQDSSASVSLTVE